MHRVTTGKVQGLTHTPLRWLRDKGKQSATRQTRCNDAQSRVAASPRCAMAPIADVPSPEGASVRPTWLVPPCAPPIRGRHSLPILTIFTFIPDFRLHLRKVDVHSVPIGKETSWVD